MLDTQLLIPAYDLEIERTRSMRTRAVDHAIARGIQLKVLDSRDNTRVRMLLPEHLGLTSWSLALEWDHTWVHLPAISSKPSIIIAIWGLTLLSPGDTLDWVKVNYKREEYKFDLAPLKVMTSMQHELEVTLLRAAQYLKTDIRLSDLRAEGYFSHPFSIDRITPFEVFVNNNQGVRITNERLCLNGVVVDNSTDA